MQPVDLIVRNSTLATDYVVHEMSLSAPLGGLKLDFHVSKGAMDINLDDLPFFIYACSVLHNYCEMN